MESVQVLMVSTNLMKLRKVKYWLALRFSPEEQDVAALALVEQTGALKHIDNGNMDKGYICHGTYLGITA
jgi:muramidase (phage lysozyme)